MGSFDLVLNEVESKFGLGEREAGSLMSGILSFFNEQAGGLAGFLDRFKQAGMGSFVSSWLGGESKNISPEQLESVVGRNSISNIASRAGLSLSTAAAALAFMLPKVIQKLTPGGSIPAHLPTELTSYGSAASRAVTNTARSAVDTVEGASSRRFMWPLLTVLGLAFFAIWMWRGRAPVFNPEAEVQAAAGKASAALAGLRPGYSGRDLVSALNLYVISFGPGSAEIPDSNREFLNRTAQAIQAAPAGTRIEIGGHTDNSGDPGSNLVLSEQRANAVRDYLLQQGVSPDAVVAKGYGSAKPIANNGNDEGRFRNRRIEFTVVS